MMMPAQAATQKIRRPAMCRSNNGETARRCRHTNSDAGHQRRRPRTERHGCRHREPAAKLIASTNDATSTIDMHPAEIVDRIGGLVHVGGHQHDRHASARRTASGAVTRNTELHAKWSSSQPDSNDPSAATAPPIADHSAIALVRAGPFHSAVISARRRRVGHPGREPAEQSGQEQHLDRRGDSPRAGRRGPSGSSPGSASACGRNGRRPHRNTAPTRPGRGNSRPNQVEGGLAGVEGLADIRQGDVGDGQVQVRHRGDQDQRSQHPPGPAGRIGRAGGARPRARLDGRIRHGRPNRRLVANRTLFQGIAAQEGGGLHFREHPIG